MKAEYSQELNKEVVTPINSVKEGHINIESQIIEPFLPKEDNEFFNDIKSSGNPQLLSHLETNSKLHSIVISRSESQEFIRLKDPTDGEDIIIQKKRSETMNYDFVKSQIKPIVENPNLGRSIL